MIINNSNYSLSVERVKGMKYYQGTNFNSSSHTYSLCGISKLLNFHVLQFIPCLKERIVTVLYCSWVLVSYFKVTLNFLSVLFIFERESGEGQRDRGFEGGSALIAVSPMWGSNSQTMRS